MTKERYRESTTRRTATKGTEPASGVESSNSRYRRVHGAEACVRQVDSRPARREESTDGGSASQSAEEEKERAEMHTVSAVSAVTYAQFRQPVVARADLEVRAACPIPEGAAHAHRGDALVLGCELWVKIVDEGLQRWDRARGGGRARHPPHRRTAKLTSAPSHICRQTLADSSRSRTRSGSTVSSRPERVSPPGEPRSSSKMTRVSGGSSPASLRQSNLSKVYSQWYRLRSAERRARLIWRSEKAQVRKSEFAA